jgi:hypothetical protein
VKRHVVWLLAVVLVVLGVAAFFLAQEQRRPAAAAVAGQARPDSGYQASDPALVAATGRPQLVEFYHRA